VRRQRHFCEFEKVASSAVTSPGFKHWSGSNGNNWGAWYETYLTGEHPHPRQRVTNTPLKWPHYCRRPPVPELGSSTVSDKPTRQVGTMANGQGVPGQNCPTRYLFEQEGCRNVMVTNTFKSSGTTLTHRTKNWASRKLSPTGFACWFKKTNSPCLRLTYGKLVSAALTRFRSSLNMGKTRSNEPLYLLANMDTTCGVRILDLISQCPVLERHIYTYIYVVATPQVSCILIVRKNNSITFN